MKQLALKVLQNSSQAAFKLIGYTVGAAGPNGSYAHCQIKLPNDGSWDLSKLSTTAKAKPDWNKCIDSVGVLSTKDGLSEVGYEQTKAGQLEWLEVKWVETEALPPDWLAIPYGQLNMIVFNKPAVDAVFVGLSDYDLCIKGHQAGVNLHVPNAVFVKEEDILGCTRLHNYYTELYSKNKTKFDEFGRMGKSYQMPSRMATRVAEQLFLEKTDTLPCFCPKSCLKGNTDWETFVPKFSSIITFIGHIEDGHHFLSFNQIQTLPVVIWNPEERHSENSICLFTESPAPTDKVIAFKCKDEEDLKANGVEFVNAPVEYTADGWRPESFKLTSRTKAQAICSHDLSNLPVGVTFSIEEKVGTEHLWTYLKDAPWLKKVASAAPKRSDLDGYFTLTPNLDRIWFYARSRSVIDYILVAAAVPVLPFKNGAIARSASKKNLATFTLYTGTYYNNLLKDVLDEAIKLGYITEAWLDNVPVGKSNTRVSNLYYTHSKGISCKKLTKPTIKVADVEAKKPILREILKELGMTLTAKELLHNLEALTPDFLAENLPGVRKLQAKTHLMSTMHEDLNLRIPDYLEENRSLIEAWVVNNLGEKHGMITVVPPEFDFSIYKKHPALPALVTELLDIETSIIKGAMFFKSLSNDKDLAGMLEAALDKKVENGDMTYHDIAFLLA